VILQPLPVDLRDRYLAYLGVTRSIEPTSGMLVELHRAQLDRVAYTNLEIQLGRTTSIDPQESIRRIISGHGGYCFHLNGAFAALLLSVGFDVILARGAVPTAGEDGHAWGNHIIPLVRLGAEIFIVDTGIGDGIRDPLPLGEDIVTQAPFRYRLEHLGGVLWRLHHDERASIAGFDLDVTPVELSSFAAQHAFLSTSEDSYFVKNFIAQRRHADHVLTLRGCVLTRTDAHSRSRRDIHNEHEWLALVVREFGLCLADVSQQERLDLWQRVRATHEAWNQAGRPIARLQDLIRPARLGVLPPRPA